MLLEKALKTLRLAESEGCTFADVRAEGLTISEIQMSGNHLKKRASGIEERLGIRSICDGSEGFSATTLFTSDYLERAARASVRHAKAVGRIRETSGSWSSTRSSPVVDKVENETKHSLTDSDFEEKVALVSRILAETRMTRGLLAQARYMDAEGQHVFVSTEGSEVLTKVSRAIIAINIKTVRNGRIGSVEDYVGGAGGLEVVSNENYPRLIESLAKRAVNRASTKTLPDGAYPVVLGPKACGALAHEVIGHCCEADLVLGGESLLEGYTSKQIASEFVTVYDDPTLPGKWGSMRYDDEGVATAKTALLRGGYLEGCVHNRETAYRMGAKPAGNARSPDALVIPVPRMTNTYVESGSATKEEIVSSIKKGILIESSESAAADLASGVYQLSGSDVFEIDKGEITEPLGNVQILDNISETLRKVDAVGDRVQLFPGFCRKRGQTVMVSYGGPYMRIKEIGARFGYV